MIEEDLKRNKMRDHGGNDENIINYLHTLKSTLVDHDQVSRVYSLYYFSCTLLFCLYTYLYYTSYTYYIYFITNIIQDGSRKRPHQADNTTSVSRINVYAAFIIVYTV